VSKPAVLLVYARGGPPLRDVLPSVASVADVHFLQLAPPPGHPGPIARHCASVTDSTGIRAVGEDLVDHITAAAQCVRADGVLTFSEFAVIATARAADRLGTRGAGPGVAKARSKRLMRTAWESAGAPIPRFHLVDTVEDLHRAWQRLGPPILLKSAWGAGSIGQVVIERPSAIEESFGRATAAIDAAAWARMSELYSPEAGAELIAEEIIAADRSSWHDDARYADYLSVEGLVVDGVCRPVCITERLPTLRPFVERGNLGPSPLPEPAQREIERAAVAAVDALGLDTCGTHTELKLLPDGTVRLLETAARFGGHLLTRQVAAAYGIDLVEALTRAAVGELPDLPDRMLVRCTGRAAGTVNMIAADSRGRPWAALPRCYPARLDLGPLVSPASRIESVPDFAVAPGTSMPAYTPSRGSLNLAGVCYLEAPDPGTLVRDAYSVLDGLEAVILPAVIPRRRA
jgi:biotin carboxylase